MSTTGERRRSPHLRCGICDEPFELGERGVYVDDERCHQACAEEQDGSVRYDLAAPWEEAA